MATPPAARDESVTAGSGSVARRGAGGINHVLQRFSRDVTPVFESLANPAIAPQRKEKIAQGVLEEAGPRSLEHLARQENDVLVGLRCLRGQRA